jgi:deazaflavin-dependent oxidoreductase (nitroreductase family)
MPLPDWLGRFNRRASNRVTGPFAGRLPGFAIVIHTGRRSGRSYRTPVNFFRLGSEFVIALTYGRETDWVRNVTAAGGCEVKTRGRTLSLQNPRIVNDEKGTPVPSPIRVILRALKVTEFMMLSPETGTH